MHFDFESDYVIENDLNYILVDQNNSADIDLVIIDYYTLHNYNHYFNNTLAITNHYSFSCIYSIMYFVMG